VDRTQRKQIIWLKWIDPLAHLVESEEEDEQDAVLARASKDDFLEGEEAPSSSGPGKGSAGPAVSGPWGIVPLHEHNLPGKLFNFWLGHANFDLTKQVVAQIEAVPGVETLDVFTRYRFRLGVGKAFDQRAVRADVEDSVCQEPGEHDTADLLADALAQRYPHWQVFVLEDGRLEAVGGQDRKDVQTRGQVWKAQAEEVIDSED
jgi:hypothetical protein